MGGEEHRRLAMRCQALQRGATYLPMQDPLDDGRGFGGCLLLDRLEAVNDVSQYSQRHFGEVVGPFGGEQLPDKDQGIHLFGVGPPNRSRLCL